jgi:dihydromethanopterin reductase (acceptor)
VTAAGGTAEMWPRRIDLDNVERLRSLEGAATVGTMAELTEALETRPQCLSESSS